MVQHCEAKGRRGCGKRGTTWAVVSFKAWGGSVRRNTIAFCDGCLAADVRSPEVVGPIVVTPKAVA